MMKKKICVSVLMLIVLVFTGCSKNTDDSKDAPSYDVYFCDSGHTTLITHKHAVKSDVTDEIIADLVAYMEEDISINALSVFSGKHIISKTEFLDGVIYVTLNEGYMVLNEVDKVLIKAAIVKTLVQIQSVNYISFYINDKPMLNATGDSAVMYDADSFVENTQEVNKDVKNLDTVLYFADNSGYKLVAKKVKIICDRSESYYQAVVEQLINGPTSDDCYRTIPNEVKIIGISVKEGICYVNFDSAFMATLADVSAEVTIYSIVNSLCELGDITQVQFMVNGSQDKVFRDRFPLSKSYERNLDLVVK